MNPERLGGGLFFRGFWQVQAVVILLRLALLGLSSACRAIKAIATTWTISSRAYVATSDQPKPKPPSNTPMLLVTAHVRGHRASRFPPATLNSTPKKTPNKTSDPTPDSGNVPIW